ncbi:MAG: type-2 restriction enzyme TthHB8I [Fimbriimonadales bacterium]|nr:MAG: type-2 restriction enzyme TthHB8I [Fimbriimonadales bacterium]
MELLQVDPSEYRLSELEEFLSEMSVDYTLREYKGFEVDLKGDLNPTELLEKLFWREKRWIDFPQFASLYWQMHKAELQRRFLKKFASLGSSAYQHLQARLYRTQFGFLTEYHAVILTASVFTPEGYTVWRGSALDRIGVDFQIVESATQLQYNIHIFVDSPRAWFYREKKRQIKSSDKVSGQHIDFPYTLKSGRIHSLRMLPNGFGVYTEDYVKHLLKLIKDESVYGKLQKPMVDCSSGLLFE